VAYISDCQFSHNTKHKIHTQSKVWDYISTDSAKHLYFLVLVSLLCYPNPMS